MRNLFLSFVTVLFLVPLSRAGVSSVGNGGGLAELEFIFYFNNSDKIVNYCLAAENSCHLTLEQSRVWKQLQRTVKKFQSSYTVDLISESSQP